MGDAAMRTCVLIALLAVASLAATSPPSVSSQDHAEHGDPGVGKQDAASTEVRLAETKLKLAEAELRRAMDRNRRIPSTIQKMTVESLRRNVDVAKQQVDLARQGDQPWHVLHIRQMETALKTAESALDRAKAMNRITPRMVDEFDLERLRLKAEVARLSLTKARDPANVKSPEAHLQWQIDQLRDEIDRLKDHVERLSITSEARS